MNDENKKILDYQIELALVYFYDNPSAYSFHELMQKLGYSQHFFRKMIDIMFEKELIEYKDYLIHVTSVGEKKIENLIISQKSKEVINSTKSLDALSYLPQKLTGF